MKGINKGIVAIAVVMVVTGFVFYQYFANVFRTAPSRPTGPATVQAPATKKDAEAMSATPTVAREVSATTTYIVPEADITHNIKFTVALDAEGKIVGVKMVEMPKDESSDKQKEFADNLTVMIKGKKLSELTKVDKVGKSTLTTDSFNSVVDDLRSQL